MMESAADCQAMGSSGGRRPSVCCAVLGGVCALVIGVFVWTANSGVLEVLGSKAELSYYNLLVQGFRDGQLNLKTSVPPELTRLADPYDLAANTRYLWVD